MIRYILLFTALLAGQYAAAEDVRIASVKIHDVTEPMTFNNNCSQGLSSFDLGLIGWGDIITVGEKLWEVVTANKPVVNLQTPVAFALPQGLKCWSDLDGWQAPRVQSIDVSYKNYLDIEVVKFRLRLQYTYGGGYQGKGKYLANVAVFPADLEVSWGYTFDAKVEAEQAVNIGTSADPVAGLELNLLWTTKTVLKESDNSLHFFVQGDGVSKTDY